MPRLVQAARDNIKECPGHLRQGRPRDLARRAEVHREPICPRAFSPLDDLHILGDLADTSTEAATAITCYIDYLETDLAPRAKASFRLGRERFEQKLKLEEGITLSADRLLAIALRELHEVQEEFRSVAGRLNGGDPIDAWRHAKEQHPEPGQLVAVAQAQVKELEEFLQRQAIVSLPESEPVVVAPSPEFYRWAFASMWTPGPFESKPSRAYYYLTDVDRALAARAAEGAHARLQHPDALEHLDPRGVSRATSSTTSICARSSRRSASRRSSRPRRSSKAGRTTASR